MTTLKQYIADVQAQKVDPAETVFAYLEKSKKEVKNGTNAIISTTEEYVEKHMKDASAKPLGGAPIIIKDNILVQ